MQALQELVDRLGAPDGAGDPGRVHEEGRIAREAIEIAREQLAALAAVSPSRVVFTASGTEAANTAVFSAVASGRPGGAIVCSKVEHSSVRAASEKAGPVLELDVDSTGRVEPGHLRSLLSDPSTPAPALVNCQWANHEVGAVQPLTEVVDVCRQYAVPLHVDASAAFGHVPTDLGALGAQYVSVSAHKMGGPAGVGALIIGRGVRIRPLLLGGSEERGRRAGGENLLGIVGFGAAAGELTEGSRLENECSRATSQRDELIATATTVEGVELLGPRGEGLSLPHIACVSVGGVLGEAVLLALDRQGIAAHSGSACSSESLEPSPVLAAMGADPDRSLRLSLGWSSSELDIAAFAEAFPAAVGSLRKLATAESPRDGSN